MTEAKEGVNDNPSTPIPIPKEFRECLEMLTASLIQQHTLIDSMRKYMDDNNLEL